MRHFLNILLLIFIATMAGCYYDNAEKLYPVISNSCDLTNVTFSGTVKPILQASCLSCHSNSNASSAGGGIKLENYADVKSSASGRLMGAVNHLSGYSAMPKGGGKLSTCEISQLQLWIDNGMLNN